MAKQMLIDASHPEETRVVVLENGRVEELDIDTSTKKQIKGNIYLARVGRIEPSLQSAFIEYGGNRQGFLMFSEIHPDYYQIPVADREELKEMIKSTDGSDDADDEPTRPRLHNVKKYRIQDVIRPGQVMLVQIIKEERGNKGAAVTTYLSLAGRYSVLMPNSDKGGAISRKITNISERKELRDIIENFPIPQGMGIIIRTAGQGKTKTEIKRDYDYLIKTWMNIREKTLESLAPTLIHEEGDIIKRSIRDVFTPDIDEIWVDGEAGFNTTRDFTKLLLPTQAKKVKLYKGIEPLFMVYRIEHALETLHSNIVQLRSGGYLVIDQTEALVAVDVNSGRAVKEQDIEETALRTNLETCEELARQLKLRDMAGLIVIDFIDMSEDKNNDAVERKLRECLKPDRARIHIGKMSNFGLIEMSRQRLHSSFLESSYQPCPHCGGKGMLRSIESCAMHAMHIIEEVSFRTQNQRLLITLPLYVGAYVLNNKRNALVNIEKKYNVIIQIIPDSNMLQPSDFKLERIREDGERVNINLNSIKQQERLRNMLKKSQEDAKISDAQPKFTGKDDDEGVETSAPTSAPVEIKSESVTAPEGNDQPEKKSKKRSDWRKKQRERRNEEMQKRRALKAEQGDAESTFAENTAPEMAPAEATMPETAPVELAPVEEPHFKVVEQAPLSDVAPIAIEKEESAEPVKKSERKYANKKTKAEKAKTESAESAEKPAPAPVADKVPAQSKKAPAKKPAKQQAEPEAKTEAEPVVKTDTPKATEQETTASVKSEAPVVTKTSKGETPVPATPASDEPANPKTGWWTKPQ